MEHDEIFVRTEGAKNTADRLQQQRKQENFTGERKKEEN